MSRNSTFEVLAHVIQYFTQHMEAQPDPLPIQRGTTEDEMDPEEDEVFDWDELDS